MAMVDAGDTSRALRAAAAPRKPRQKWEVEYARYFVTPRRGPSTPPPPGLRHISRGKRLHQGTWLPASSRAALCISRPSIPSAVPVLTVSIGGVVFEEHFVSILHFSWPQVTCVTQCPIRGSRVLFMSFCDKYKQIQKFAVRFPQLSDAESFLNRIKECSVEETMDIIPSGSDYMCEDSSASEYIASCEPQHRLDDASSFEEPASNHVTEAPALTYHEEPHQPVLEPVLTSNVDNICSGFPPSFSQMLANYSTASEKGAEEPCPVTTTNHAPQEVMSVTTTDHASQEVHALYTSHDSTSTLNLAMAADKGKNALEGICASKATGDLVTRMKTYMDDASFHDMLFKLEKVIDELGGDMSL